MDDLYARFVPKPTDVATGQRSEVTKDRDRLIHSSALRRLQRKSQIVGSQTSDFFRTRLTHTLECAQIGRAIACRVPNAEWADAVEELEHLPDVVEAACLAHDLGHPPFGHNGELALQQAMREHSGSLFEGNAQSFRVVTFLEPKLFGATSAGIDRWVGLNLTRATLRAMSKYPWVETAEMLAQSHPKFGVYAEVDDQDYFAWVWDGEVANAERTLATGILDTADDIAYAVHDFEDGVWAGMIPLYELVAIEERAVRRLAAKVMERDPVLFSKEEDVEEALRDLLDGLTGEYWAIRPFDRAKQSRAYLKNFSAGLIHGLIHDVTSEGRFARPEEDVRRRVDLLTGMAWVWMIERSDLATRRYAQRRVVRDLFEGYWEDPNMLPQRKEWEEIADTAPEGLLSPPKARLICDHIAGMTDLYAVSVHAEMYQGGQSLALLM